MRGPLARLKALTRASKKPLPEELTKLTKVPEKLAKAPFVSFVSSWRRHFSGGDADQAEIEERAGASADTVLDHGQKAGEASGPENARLSDRRIFDRLTIKERMMAYRTRNLVTGLQLRAARTLAGMTQKDLAAALGVNERAVRFWERKRDRRPTSAPNDARIEQALLDRGVLLFAEPTPGSRLAEKR